jgi:hypothetical protein
MAFSAAMSQKIFQSFTDRKASFYLIWQHLVSDFLHTNMFHSTIARAILNLSNFFAKLTEPLLHRYYIVFNITNRLFVLSRFHDDF